MTRGLARKTFRGPRASSPLLACLLELEVKVNRHPTLYRVVTPQACCAVLLGVDLTSEAGLVNKLNCSNLDSSY